MPLTFTIVTPSLNQAASVRATVESVLTQTYPHIEYLVVDGGSTDGTLDVLRSYGERVRWVSRGDAGQADAIARGFDETGGDVLTWLNSDDTLSPTAVAEGAAALAAQPGAALVYGTADFIDVDGRFIGTCAHVEPWDYGRLVNYSDFIVQPAAFFRRSAYEAVGGLDRSLHYAMDYDLWLKLGKRYPVAVHVPRVWAHYRWGGANKSATGAWRRIEEVRAVAARYGARGGLPGYFRLEEVYLHAAEGAAAVRRGQVGKALRAAKGAAGALASPRAIKSLIEPRTWRVIYTGQVLRRVARRGAGGNPNGG